MSVLINTNTAATLAANNLASSNSLLQRSLNRLSSGSKIVNPADDAGGLAVSMKLSAAAKRQGAVRSNLGNSLSYLQSQDGVLKAVGKVLERIGELKTLASDPTKNSDDLANYNSEYSALRSELTSLAGEKFNGISLFGSNGLAVGTTEDGSGSLSLDGVDLLGTASTAGSGFATYDQDFSSFVLGLGADYGYSTSGGTVSVAANTLTLSASGAGNYANMGLNTPSSFTGPLEINLDFSMSNGDASTFSVELGWGNELASVVNGTDIANDGANHTLRITLDGAGNASAFLDGSSTAFHTASGLGTSGDFHLINTNQGSTDVTHLTVAPLAVTGSVVNDVATAGSLAALNLSDVTDALQSVASYRATNGAQQSRLGFASEVLSVNQANLEAANSRITDVDVAEESTALARYNILVQAGTSMLAQANQSAQTALRLLG